MWGLFVAFCTRDGSELIEFDDEGVLVEVVEEINELLILEGAVDHPHLEAGMGKESIAHRLVQGINRDEIVALPRNRFPKGKAAPGKGSRERGRIKPRRG